MKVILIVNDQIENSFSDVKSLLLSSKNSGEVQILENHTEAFFLLKNNSVMKIETQEEKIRNFKLQSENCIAEIQNNNIVRIVCDKISEII